MPTDRPQPWPRGQEARSPEGCASDIGRIIQHAADRGSMPIRRSLPGLTAHLLQAPAYCAQAHSIETDPCKDETNDVCLRFHHLEARHSTALNSAHIAIPVGSPVSALTDPDCAAWRRPRRPRSRILARSYSAITP
jgi:hypothetical protein